MTRAHFVRVVEEVLDSLPIQFRERIHNLVVLVEDRPKLRRKKPPVPAGKAGPRKPRNLLLGVFQGVPATREKRVRS